VKKKRSTLALAGATLVELNPARVRRASVVIEDGKIAAITDKPPADADSIDCDGLLVMPGFVCAHTHLYSSLARGMPPPHDPPQSFSQILERVWWKLDRALDDEAVEVSALVGAVEAVRSGATTLIDHHASPACIDGSLDRIGGALEQVGVRGVLCYETSDRGGADEARAGLRENDRFLDALAKKPRPLLRGMVGAHAAFTLSHETAEALADVAARHGAGVHIHVAEDEIDAKKDDRTVIDWLAIHGLLSARALLAHAIHVSDADAARIIATGAHVVHNPRSNLNNRVGYARPARYKDRLLLGTDGIGADMRVEAHAAFLAAREHHHGFDPIAALERNRAFASFQYGLSLALEPGAEADLVALDYRAPTPLNEGNAAGHLLFGLPGAPVRHVLCAGKPILRDGRLTTVDEAALAARAQECAQSLWSRMNK
jgi:putative selenium metabolism protein SsnA